MCLFFYNCILDLYLRMCHQKVMDFSYFLEVKKWWSWVLFPGPLLFFFLPKACTHMCMWECVVIGLKSVAQEGSKVNWVISEMHNPDLIINIIVKVYGLNARRLSTSWGKTQGLSFFLDETYCTKWAIHQIASCKRAWNYSQTAWVWIPAPLFINSWLGTEPHLSHGLMGNRG